MKIMAFGPIISWQINGETMETVTDFIFLGSKICRWWFQPWNKKTLTPGKKSYDQLSVLESRDITDKGLSNQSYGFSSSHVCTQELNHKESWAAKKWCFGIVVLEKTLENPLDTKEIKAVHPKGNQSLIFTGGTDVEAEAPIYWSPDAKSQLIGKDSDAGKDWGQEEKGMTEDEMVGWHHWLDGHELEQAPGVGDGQGSLACYNPWGCKELDMTEWLNELNWTWVWASLVTQTVKNPPAVWETWVQSLGWEDPMEEGMAARSSILVWRVPVDRGACTVLGVTKSWTQLIH